MSHGTATNPQFMQVLTPLGIAAATVLNDSDFEVGELIKKLNKSGEPLTDHLRLVFTAIATGQTLALQPSVECPLPVWKTIKAGKLKTLDNLRKTAKQSSCNISDYSSDILGKPAFSLSQAETEYDLVVVSGTELGFIKPAPRKEIYAAAKQRFGLQTCPAEIGPELRLQYTDQPNGEWLLIGMEPITDSGSDLGVFSVERVGGGRLWLGAGYGRPGYVFGPEIRWVFVRPRK